MSEKRKISDARLVQMFSPLAAAEAIFRQLGFPAESDEIRELMKSLYDRIRKDGHSTWDEHARMNDTVAAMSIVGALALSSGRVDLSRQVEALALEVAVSGLEPL